MIINTYNARATADNLPIIAQSYDIIVDATDNFAARFLISDTCQAQHKPMVHGAICGLRGQVSVLCKGSTTYRTLFPDEEATLAMPHPGKQVLGATPAVVGSVQAAQTVMLICHKASPLDARLWTIDLSTMESHVIDL